MRHFTIIVSGASLLDFWIHLGCVSLSVGGASLIGFTSGASVYESRVRHCWTFGFTSGASVYQSGVRHFSNGGIHLGCVSLPVRGASRIGFTSGASVYESRVRHFTWVRQFTSLGCVSLLLLGAPLFEWRHLPRVRQFTVGGASLFTIILTGGLLLI